MKELRLLIDVVSKQRVWFIILLFFSFVMYTFRNEITRVIDLRLLGKDVVVNSVEKDVLINKSLRSLMLDAGADRAYIFRFHNGVTYYDGTHKSKMSCDYEVVEKGISREAERLQNLPTALYADWINEVILNNMYVYDISYLENEIIRYMLEIQGVKGLAVAPYYRDGKLFALIGIDYVREINKDEMELYNKNKDINIHKFKRRIQNIGDII